MMGATRTSPTPGDRVTARVRLQVAADAELVVFVGSMLPLKGIRWMLRGHRSLKDGYQLVTVLLLSPRPVV